MSRTDPRTGPGWPAWTGAAILLAAAAVLSFTTLAELAARAGYSDWRRWLIPVVIDAAVLVAVRFWLAAGLIVAANRMGFWLALAMLALSIAGNALEHWLTSGGWLSPVLSTIPPIILGAVGVLVDLGLRDQPASDQPATTSQPTPASQPAAAPLAITVTTRPAGQPASVLAIPAVQILGQPADPIAEPVSHPDSPPARQLSDRLSLITHIHTRTSQRQPARPASGAWTEQIERARVVMASQPRIGRPALARALGIPTSQARKLLEHLADQPDQPALTDDVDTTKEHAHV